MSTPIYQYHFYDLVTRSYIDTLPLTGVSFSQGINGGGDFGASLSVSDDIYAQNKVAWKDATAAQKTWIVVQRNDAVIWGGMLFGRAYSSKSQTLDLSGTTLDGFGTQRIEHYPTFRGLDTGTYSMTTLVDKIFGMFSDTAPAMSFDPKVYTGGNPTINWEGQYNQYANQYVDQLTKQEDNGIEYYWECSWDPTKNSNVPLRYPVIGQPRLPATNLGMIAHLSLTGGNIIEYSWKEDGNQIVTEWATFGGGNGAAQVMGKYYDNYTISHGYPYTTGYSTYTDITNQNILIGLAKRDFFRAQANRQSLSLVIKPDVNFDIQVIKPGHIITVEIDDPYFRPGDFLFQGDPTVPISPLTCRVVKYSITPDDAGNETVSVDVELVL